MCFFVKQKNSTVLKVSWDGNIGLLDCFSCCMRWFLTVNGEECSNPGPIDASLVYQLNPTVNSINLVRPASIVGICREFGGKALSKGAYGVALMVKPCQENQDLPLEVPNPSDARTGYNSVSRFIVEEIPESETDNCKNIAP